MFKAFVTPAVVGSLFLLSLALASIAVGQESAKPVKKPAEQIPMPPPDDLTELTKLHKDQDIWFDAKRKLVVVDGQICLREGQLELFACPRKTKEHEAVVAVNATPETNPTWGMLVHTALLRVGAVAGKPVQFDPKYVPATGTVVDVWVLYKDKDGKQQKVRAQEWVRQVKTGKAMDFPWVFGGSKLFVDEEQMKTYYQGDYGAFLCVSNFPEAILDLPVPSSVDNADLQFEAFTEKIPEKGTKVRLVLVPRLEKKDEPKKVEPSKDPPKKVEPSKDPPKKVEPKKDAPKAKP